MELIVAQADLEFAVLHSSGWDYRLVPTDLFRTGSHLAQLGLEIAI